MSGGTAHPLRVAILGSGIIGHNHALAVLRHPRLRITAVIDPLPSANQGLADRITEAGAPAPAQFATLADALAGSGSAGSEADGGVDVVVICTPSGLHAEAAQEALAAGCHVVIEKPVDVSLPRARRLAEAAARAQARGQVCSVISQHRFDPASAVVARAVADGRFGRITSGVASVAWWRSQAYYDSAGWRGTWDLDGGGATANQAVHTVDLLVWLLGQPVEVYAHTGLLAHEGIEVEDVAVATVRFASGALAVVHATTAAYPGLSVRLQVHGALGSAVIHDDQLEYFHAAAPGPSGGAAGADGPPVNQAADLVPAEDLRGGAKPADAFIVGHLRQYHDIVDAIDGSRPPGVGVDDAVLALAVVRAVYLSATLARPVAIGDVLNGDHDGVTVVTPDLGGKP